MDKNLIFEWQVYCCNGCNEKAVRSSRTAFLLIVIEKNILDDAIFMVMA